MTKVLYEKLSTNHALRAACPIQYVSEVLKLKENKKINQNRKEINFISEMRCLENFFAYLLTTCNVLTS